MKCPNCDFIDKDEAFGDPATCPECGAIYEKALKLKQFKQELETQKAASAAQQEAPTKTESWFVRGLKGASDGVKKGRANRKKSDVKTLCTEDFAPALIRVEEKRGGCLKPITTIFAILFLYSLVSTSCTSYNGYVERSRNPELALQHSQQQTEIRKAKDDDMRRIKIERMAREGIKPKLYDPDTAKFRNQRGGCGEVNAKNIFGAYTGYKRFLYGGSDFMIIEGDPALAEGAFDDAWGRLCGEGGKLAF